MKVIIYLMLLSFSICFAELIEDEEFTYEVELDHSLDGSDVYQISQSDWQLFLNHHEKVKKVSEVPMYLCGGEGVGVYKKYENKVIEYFDSPCTDNFNTKSEFHFDGRSGIFEIQIDSVFAGHLEGILKGKPTKRIRASEVDVVGWLDNPENYKSTFDTIEAKEIALGFVERYVEFSEKIINIKESIEWVKSQDILTDQFKNEYKQTIDSMIKENKYMSFDLILDAQDIPTNLKVLKVDVYARRAYIVSENQNNWMLQVRYHVNDSILLIDGIGQIRME